MAPRQELIRLREGFAQQGEAWLRQQLKKLSAQQLRGLAGAAKVQQLSGGCRLSKPKLQEALWRSIAEQEYGGIGGKGCRVVPRPACPSCAEASW